MHESPAGRSKQPSFCIFPTAWAGQAHLEHSACSCACPSAAGGPPPHTPSFLLSNGHPRLSSGLVAGRLIVHLRTHASNCRVSCKHIHCPGCVSFRQAYLPSLVWFSLPPPPHLLHMRSMLLPLGRPTHEETTTAGLLTGF
jgi:hypothetical protein